MSLYGVRYGWPDWGRPGILGRLLAGPGKAIGAESPFRERRVFFFSSVTARVVGGDFALVSSAHDMAPSGTASWDTYAADTSNVFDHDDDTYAYRNHVLTAGEVVDMLVLDLGSAKDLFILAVHGSGITTLPSRVYISEDCSSWILLSETTAEKAFVVARHNIRCVKWEIENQTTSSATPSQKLFTIELYEPSDRERIYFAEPAIDTVTLFVDDAYYMLYEVIYEHVPAWG